MSREKTLIELFNGFGLLYNDLNNLIAQYEKNIQYDTYPCEIIRKVNYDPYGISGHGHNLYICYFDRQEKIPIYIYNLKSNEIKISSQTFLQPNDIEFYENKIYIIDIKNVSICNLEFQLLSTFGIPRSHNSLNCLKVANHFIYVTVYGFPQVYVYTHDGKIAATIGNLENPKGITFNQNYLYICNFDSHKINICALKDNYSFICHWGTEGEFSRPYSIYYWENIFFVGDDYSIQIFDENRKFLQKIGSKQRSKENGEFRLVRGICIINNLLYVSDLSNRRIQVFKNI